LFESARRCDSKLLAVKLTVVFPTGRPEAALSRWLSHAAESGFPYPMVVGASSAAASTRAAPMVPVRGRSLFDDALQCLEQVATPYAMLLDARDFVLASGLAALIIAITPLWFLVLDSLLRRLLELGFFSGEQFEILAEACSP